MDVLCYRVLFNNYLLLLKNFQQKLCLIVLQIEKFEGSYIGYRVGFEFRLVMVKCGIEKKVKVIIMDNVLNMDIVIQVLGVELKLRCFVYIFNFVLNKVLNDFLFLKVFGRVRLVVIFFYKSNIVIEFLKVKWEGFNLFIY